MNSKEKAKLCAEAISSKKGMDVQILDLRPIFGFTDFFVIASGTSDRHVRTLCDAVVERIKASGEQPFGREGEETARWLLIDLGDVVVHVFQRDARDFYSLERLWGEAESVKAPRVAEG